MRCPKALKTDSFRPCDTEQQGYVLGNSVTGSEIDFNSRIPFAREMGLISDELYEVRSMKLTFVFLFQQCSANIFLSFFLQSLERICKGKYVNVDPSNTECVKLVEEYNKVHTRECFHLMLCLLSKRTSLISDLCGFFIVYKDSKPISYIRTIV